MPNFPSERYQSKRDLTTQQPAAFQQQTDTTGQILDEVAEVGQKAIDTTVKWSAAVDQVQKTSDQTAVKMKYMELISQAENDPDTSTQKQRWDQLQKIRAEHGKGFMNKGAEAENALELDYMTRAAEIQLQGIFKKKFVSEGQAAALQNIDLMVQNPNENTEESIKNFLAGQVKVGIFDADNAYKIGASKANEARFNRFLIDFRDNPIEAEKKVLAGGYGMDAEQSEKARTKLKELKVIQREQEGNVYSDMGLRVTTGQLKEDEIDAAMELNKRNPNEGITEAHGKQLKAAFYRDITKRIGEKEFKKYREAIDYVFANSTQDKIRGYEAILEAYSDGMTPDETNFLKQVLETKKDVIFANKAAAGKKILETLFGARPKNVQRETQELLSYAKRIAGGMDPYTAARETSVESIAKDHPAVINDPDLAVAFTPGTGLKNIPKVKRESSTSRQE